MSELSLEALGYTADEARVSRRAHDLTTPPEKRAASLRIILSHSPDCDWQPFAPEPRRASAACNSDMEEAA